MTTPVLLPFATMVQRFAMAARASARAPLDFTVGSVFRALAEAQAAVGLWLQWLIVVVLRQTRLATSQGDEVDSWGADFGFTRLAAAPATGSVTLSRLTPGQAAFVPIGAQVGTTDGTQSFAVVADATNSSWAGSGYAVQAAAISVTVPVAAVTPGAAGNAQAGAVSVLASALAGIDTVTNDLPMAGGVDAEPDAAMRARFTGFVNTRARATMAAVIFAAQSVRQGLNIAVLESVTAGGFPQPGSFVVLVDDGSGAVGDDVLAQVAAAVEAVRGVGIAYVVTRPSLSLVNIAVTIAVVPGFDVGTVEGAVRTIVASYVASLQIGVGVSYFDLPATVRDVPGVARITGLQLNGGATDIPAVPTQLVRLGTLTVA